MDAGSVFCYFLFKILFVGVLFEQCFPLLGYYAGYGVYLFAIGQEGTVERASGNRQMCFEVCDYGIFQNQVGILSHVVLVDAGIIRCLGRSCHVEGMVLYDGGVNSCSGVVYGQIHFVSFHLWVVNSPGNAVGRLRLRRASPAQEQEECGAIFKDDSVHGMCGLCVISSLAFPAFRGFWACWPSSCPSCCPSPSSSSCASGRTA